MGCCGEKRKALANKASTAGRSKKNEDIHSFFVKDRPDRIFELIARGPLRVIGVSSGKAYTFRHKAHKVRVAHSDSFALMAEKDLRIVHPK